MTSTEIMNKFTYPRILGYVVTIAMHLTNAIYMRNTFHGDALEDPDVRQFVENELRFLTIWNVYLQVIYAILGLSCDVLSLANQGKDSALLKTLKRIRDPMFSCMVWPFSFTGFTLFWTLFSYERTLILPTSVDKILSSTANHVIHTAIVPVVVWELVFQPRRAPKTHVPNLILLYTYAAAYLIVLFTSYIQTGAWVYPILNILNGTIYLYLFLGVSITLVPIWYYMQWFLTDLIWNKIQEPKKIIKIL